MKSNSSWTIRRLLSLAALAALLTGCGLGESGKRGQGGGLTGGGSGGTQTATLVLFAEDQAGGDVHFFAMTLTGITLTSSTGSDVSLLLAAVELEWSARSLAPTLLSTTSVPPDTYTQLEVLVSNPQMLVFNPGTGDFESFSPTLTSSSVQIAINLTLNADDVVGLRLDFDLLNSVVSTTEVNPQFDLILTSFVIGELPGDIDDAMGTIDSVDTLTNSFTMTLVATGQQLTLDVDTGTIFDGAVSDLAGLSSGQQVEVDARLQTTGRYQALVVEVDSLTATNFLRGLVVARAPTSGDATSLTLLVLEENPDQLSVNAGDQVTFSVDANSSFSINSEDLSVIGFNFDRQELSPGQVVIVEPDSAQSTRAAQVILKQGTIPGLVGSTFGTTTFDLSPLASFYTDIGFPSLVSRTETNTEFEDLPSGLASLQTGQTVAVRGLLLFEFSQPRVITKRVRLLAPPP